MLNEFKKKYFWWTVNHPITFLTPGWKKPNNDNKYLVEFGEYYCCGFCEYLVVIVCLWLSAWNATLKLKQIRVNLGL